MNRIDDERVKFFLEHEARIREWAGLERQVIKFVDRFYRSLKRDLDEALKAGRIREGGVSSFLEGRDWPGVGLRRQSWPRGPNVRLEWQRKKALFPPRGHLVVGISTNVDRYRAPFTKETCPRLSAIQPVVARLSRTEAPEGPVLGRRQPQDIPQLPGRFHLHGLE